MHVSDIDIRYTDLMRKYVNDTGVFVDAWCPGKHEQELSEEELMQGELSAVTFKVGCYIVRSAMRVYKVCPTGYDPEREVSARQVEVAMLRESGCDKNCLEFLSGRVQEAGAAVGIMGNLQSVLWRSGLHIAHEISAKHISDPNNMFIYICRSAEARDGSWCEYIGDIYAVKESEFSLDEFASLLVYSHYEGSSFGIDIWYKFDSAGKVTRFVQNPLHLELDKVRFI